MGTIATANAGVTGAHALGLIIGGRYGAAHGVPARDRAAGGHARVRARARAVRTGARRGLRRGRGSAADAFTQLVRDAGMATRLRDIGIPAADLGQIAAETATLPMMQNAPRAVDAAEIHSWLEAAW